MFSDVLLSHYTDNLPKPWTKSAKCLILFLFYLFILGWPCPDPLGACPCKPLPLLQAHIQDVAAGFHVWSCATLHPLLRLQDRPGMWRRGHTYDEDTREMTAVVQAMNATWPYVYWGHVHTSLQTFTQIRKVMYQLYLCWWWEIAMCHYFLHDFFFF